MNKRILALHAGLLATLGIILLVAGLSCNTAGLNELGLGDLTDDTATIPVGELPTIPDDELPPGENPGPTPGDPTPGDPTSPSLNKALVVYLSQDQSNKGVLEESMTTWMETEGNAEPDQSFDYFDLDVLKMNYTYNHPFCLTESQQATSEFKNLMNLKKSYGIIFINFALQGNREVMFSGNNNVKVTKKDYYLYKLRYLTLKKVLKRYKNQHFVIWTGLSNFNRESKGNNNYSDALYLWLVQTWDENDDNIHIWDKEFPYTFDQKGVITLDEAIDAIGERMITVMNTVSKK